MQQGEVEDDILVAIEVQRCRTLDRLDEHPSRDDKFEEVVVVEEDCCYLHQRV